MEIRFGTWNVRSLYRSSLIKIDLKGIGYDIRVWSGLNWLRIGTTAMNLRVP
jgi:hypothetical protein